MSDFGIPNFMLNRKFSASKPPTLHILAVGADKT